MRMWSKHEKVAMALTLIAITFLIISCCPGGYEEATGILQGLATGLITGIVLLFVTGIKNRELKELSVRHEKIRDCRMALMEAGTLYADIYHKTYHGKKKHMSIELYSEMVQKVYSNYRKVYDALGGIDINLIPNDNIRVRLREYINSMEKELSDIGNVIKQEKLENENLDSVVDKFYKIQYEAFALQLDLQKLEDEIYVKREHNMNSII